MALYGLQITGYLIPLVTLPYLARVLHPQGLGLLLFAQAFAVWASIVLEYGFGFSASREVAQKRGQRAVLAETAAGVLGAKGVLLLVFLTIASVASWSVPTFRQHPAYIVCAIPQALAFGFTPSWYFLGTERMSRALLIEFVSRVMAAASIFLLVHGPSDAWKVLALQGATGCASNFILTVSMYREIGFHPPRWETTKDALQRGWDMFLFRSAYDISSAASTFILGLFGSSAQVGYYGGADRITKALQALTSPMAQAIYPRMSRVAAESPRRAAHAARLTLSLAAGIGLLLAAILAVTARWFSAALLGPAYNASVSVLYIFVLLLPLSTINSALVMQWMLPMGLERLATRITLAAFATNLVLAVSLAPHFTYAGVAWAIVLAEACKLIGLATVLLRGDLTPAALLRKSRAQPVELR
jgi:polysaccharide transporter, PST family